MGEWRSDRLDVPTEIIDKVECAVDMDGNIEGLMPMDLTVRMTVGYEENYLAAYGGDHDRALQTIKYVLNEAQVYWYDESLQARVTIEVRLNLRQYFREN